jgi:signal transduction histidine kinase/DNA-binding response OmpR family regulator
MSVDPAVLLVDDRPANLLALEAILEPLQLRLIKASSGREALKYLLQDDCALILLDVQMPDLDGFETAALIRARERTRYQPIIFVTAVHREESNIIKGYAHGALDYLVKPLDPGLLLAKVRVFIEQYTREKGLAQEAALRTRERDELKKRETAALADAEAQREHLHRLFMQAPAAIAILQGPGHIFELANARFEELVGKRGLVGRRGPAEVPSAETWSILDKVYAGDEPFLGNEYPGLFGLEGRLFNFAAQPTHGLEGVVTGVMVHVVEVTESVLARRRTEALARQLQETDRNKDEFLAMLGHELRNPLAPILTALHLMRLRSSSEGSEHERAIIERQVRHLTRLVDDLLDVSRATMGKIDLRREPLEVSTAVARAVEVSAPLIQAKKQKLTVTVPGLGLLIAGDPVRLAQVIGNLLNNAAKYSEENGNIDVYARRDGAEILITVKDDGRGIAADRLPNIFELFVQGDQPPDRSQGGLGVGLTLVRSLVALHGGRVEARSDGPGRGSEFTLRLPALAESGLKPAAPSRIPGSPKPARRVLVVDDNADAAEMLSHALRYSGHEVREEHDGLSALVTAAEFNPDVVLLDIGLPGMDGFEVARRLRADPRFAKLRIVALTGYGQETDKKRTSEVGIDRHLVKPVEMEQVIEAIHADET